MEITKSPNGLWRIGGARAVFKKKADAQTVVDALEKKGGKADYNKAVHKFLHGRKKAKPKARKKNA